MKTLKTSVTLILLVILVLNLTSCTIALMGDNGNHKGWYKNTNNPHHPNTTNPGKGHGKAHKNH